MGIEPVIRREFAKIENFRVDIKNVKQTAKEMSKQYIMEMEAAAKQDRIGWLAVQNMQK